jgi:hypothetical protein
MTDQSGRDVVIWSTGTDLCSRCTQAAKYFVVPYWRDAKVCPRCCIELERLYDERGWPAR